VNRTNGQASLFPFPAPLGCAGSQHSGNNLRPRHSRTATIASIGRRVDTKHRRKSIKSDPMIGPASELLGSAPLGEPKKQGLNAAGGPSGPRLGVPWWLGGFSKHVHGFGARPKNLREAQRPHRMPPVGAAPRGSLGTAPRSRRPSLGKNDPPRQMIRFEPVPRHAARHGETSPSVTLTTLPDGPTAGHLQPAHVMHQTRSVATPGNAWRLLLTRFHRAKGLRITPMGPQTDRSISTVADSNATPRRPRSRSMVPGTQVGLSMGGNFGLGAGVCRW